MLFSFVSFVYFCVGSMQESQYGKIIRAWLPRMNQESQGEVNEVLNDAIISLVALALLVEEDAAHELLLFGL